MWSRIVKMSPVVFDSITNYIRKQLVKEQVMTLETERLILRPWKEDDAESLYKYAKIQRWGLWQDGQYIQV